MHLPPSIFGALFGGGAATAGDVFGPVMSAPVVTDNGDGTFTFTWTTDEASTSRIEWGPDATPDAYAFYQEDPTLVTSHTITLTAADGLVSGNSYDWRMVSADALGNLTYGTTGASTAGTITLGDPSFSSVVLLAGNENADGGGAFTDQSTSAHVLTPFLSRAVWDNASNPTGLTWSVKGTAGDSHVGVAASADFDLGNVWTMEIQAKIADAVAGAYGIFGVGIWAGTTRCVLFEINAGKPTWWMSSDGLAAIAGINAKQMTGITTDTGWHYYTATSDGTNIRLFYDGALTDTILTSSVLHSGTGTNTVTIAQGPGDEDWANSRWASMRITKGVARWTATFTPPSLPLLHA